MKTPREYSMVPMAPSATRARSDSCSRNSSARVLIRDYPKGGIDRRQDPSIDDGSQPAGGAAIGV